MERRGVYQTSDGKSEKLEILQQASASVSCERPEDESETTTTCKYPLDLLTVT